MYIHNEIIFITSAYNNAEYIERYFFSIFDQTYTDFKIWYCLDGATDGSYDIVKKHIRSIDTLTVNTDTNRGPMASTLKNLGHHKDGMKNRIYIYLDGDDWLFNKNSLAYINRVFQDENVWVLYNGSAITSSQDPDINEFSHIGDTAYSEGDFDKGLRNVNVWKGNHLKCWRAELWDHIDTSRYEGLYHAGDQAWFFDLAELCGYEHVKTSDYALSVYNRANVINHNKVHGNGEAEVEFIKTKISKLEKLTRLSK